MKMTNFLLILFALLIGVNQNISGQTTDKDSQCFALLDDFKKYNALFTMEPYDCSSKELGESSHCMIYSSSSREYLSFVISQFFDRGRIETICLTDKNRKLKIVKQDNFTYDRMWNDPAKKVVLVSEYYLFCDDSFKKYDINRNEMDNLTNSKEKVEYFFKTVLENLK